MPKRLLSIPEGQPEKVIRTGKRQSKREGKGKGRVKKKILMINAQYAISHLWKGKCLEMLTPLFPKESQKLCTFTR